MQRCLLIVVLVCALPQSKTGLAAEAFLPALMVSDVGVTDVPAFTEYMRQANTHMRETHGVGLFLRAYNGHALGNQDGAMFVLSPAATFTELMANTRRYTQDPALSEMRAALAGIASFGAPTYLKAIRFDGTNTPGWLNNFYVATDREAQLLDDLVRVSDQLAEAGHGIPLINVFRVIGGRSDFTHLVSFNTEDEQQQGELMDSFARLGRPFPSLTTPDANTRVVRNSLYFELE